VEAGWRGAESALAAAAATAAADGASARAAAASIVKRLRCHIYFDYYITMIIILL
jgi:hypothetical protein